MLPAVSERLPAARAAEGPEAAAAPKGRREKAEPRLAAAPLRISPSFRAILLGPGMETGGRRPKTAAAQAPEWVGVGTPGPGGGGRAAEEYWACPPGGHLSAREVRVPRWSVYAGALRGACATLPSWMALAEQHAQASPAARGGRRFGRFPAV